MSLLDSLQIDEDIGAIIVGFDSAFTYGTLTTSSVLVFSLFKFFLFPLFPLVGKVAFAYYQLRNNPEILFIATNTDPIFPSAKGMLPGIILSWSF